MKNSPWLLYPIGMLCLLGFYLGACSRSSFTVEEKAVEAIHILESVPVDSVIADFPVGFGFVATGNMQFVGYYNKHRELTVASRNTSQSMWNYQILPSKVGWDSHNRIVMAIDQDQCIHISGNMHNDTLVYFKTNQPYDISSFQRVYPMVSASDEGRCTYPKFTKNAEGELLFSYRKGGSGNGITIVNKYNEQSKTFHRLTDNPLFDGKELMSAYSSGPARGPDQWFHLIWLWRDTPGCETNHDLSYARSKDLLHWESHDGKKITLPIHPKSTQLVVDPVPAGGGAINGGAKLFFDSSGQVRIAYMKYDSLGKSQIFLASAQKGEWEIQQISDWNYRWEFSGPGSIDFEIRLKACYVDQARNLVIGYWHVKNGYGELLVDAESGSLIQDRSTGNLDEIPYPKELLLPVSPIEKVSVRWLKLADNAESDTYYALRWETMGKRRFYKAPDQPVPPSQMTLYRFKN